MSAMSTTQQPIARRRRRTALVAGLAASALVLAACGGTTGEEEGGSSSAGEDTISVFGVFATPLEEPWDGAIHAALTAVEEDGKITYDHVDDLGTADEMEQALRDIIGENPDVIVGDLRCRGRRARGGEGV